MAIRKKHVYVVDDERAIANTLSLILGAAGFHVSTFYDGSEVIDHIPEVPPDVLLTDYVMPNVDGLTLARWVEEQYPHCKIVMISGNVTVQGDAENKFNRFTFLSKPVHPRDLIATLVALV